MALTQFLVALASAALVAAQTDIARVHATVVFTRHGERVPKLASSASGDELTSWGAQQLYSAGDFFRNRYIKTTGANESDSLDIHRIIDLSQDVIDNDQLLIMTAEDQYAMASAQAFLQGLYPPFLQNPSTAEASDPDSLLAIGARVEYPLNGYQYAQIRTYSIFEPHILYLDGIRNCPNHQLSVVDYYSSQEYADMARESNVYFQTVGGATMRDVLSEEQWDYYNAFDISEYLDFQSRHDTRTMQLLANDGPLGQAYEEVKWYAAQQQWAINGNTTAGNGIRTIAGETMAAQVLGLLQRNIQTEGRNYKLNLMFGDIEPFVAFSSLASIQTRSARFYGIPEHGSNMVFELYSNGRQADEAFPELDDLWVRFYFRNGSDTGYELPAYPIFKNGPSATAMRWHDFERAMSGVMTSDISDWCNACGASAIFCDAFDGSEDYPISGPDSSSTISPAVAGVIGAIVTIAVLALAAIAFAFAGVRVHRTGGRRRSGLGGYKGSDKLASDTDLVIPKAAVIAGTTTGRERVGSWELRQKEAQRPVSPLEEEDDLAMSPFADPVRPHERV